MGVRGVEIIVSQTAPFREGSGGPAGCSLRRSGVPSPRELEGGGGDSRSSISFAVSSPHEIQRSN